MSKILVTGGCGYIGSHTIADLIENGFDVISIDNNATSTNKILEGVEKIVNKKVKNYIVDLCVLDDTHAVFQENPDIIGVIHFAAYKSVEESTKKPLLYFHNNLNSLINILKCCKSFNIQNFVFSSSCTVYGEPDNIPVTETSALKTAASPYGVTKQMSEQIIKEAIKNTTINSILLRYFNPVGAHPSNNIGEIPFGKPANLVPAITQTAIGKLPAMQVYGIDYPTKDGSCIRDYIHVSDIAHAHTLALNHLINKKNKTNCEVFNLGTGNGYSVLEVIQSFEKISGIKLNYTIGLKREGDVIAIYANNDKAKKELGWYIKYSLDEMMQTAWDWELKLTSDQ